MEKTFRELIKEKVEENRPRLNPTSVKTYVSILFNFHKKIEPTDENLSWFSNDEIILKNLQEKSPQTRKTLLAALYILTGNSEYQKQMVKDCQFTNNIYKENKKTPKQEEAWMSFDEIKSIYNDYLKDVKAMFNKKLLANYSTIISYILLGCLSGASGLPPRRSLDYTEMKIHNYDPKKDNYYKNGVFYFNIYKTAKDYGLQTVNAKELAPEFNNILKNWVKASENDYLVFSTNGNKLTSPQVTRMLNNIFKKQLSVDILRHIYITEKYGKIKNEMQTTAANMGHSINEQTLYVKK